MAGRDLSDRDVRAMVRITTRRYGVVGDDEVLPWELCHDLRELVSCDDMNVNGQDSVQQVMFAAQGLSTIGDDEPSEEPYWRHYWDCEFPSYPDRSGDFTSITMISDFYSAPEWHNTGMYADCLGVFGVEHEIMVCLPCGPGTTRTIRVGFSREAGADFSERDRAVLTLLRPHLHSAYVAAKQSRKGLAPLTARQREVLQYVAAGYSNYQIARRLHVAEGTVRKHLENTFARLEVTSRSAAVARVGPELIGV